MLSALYVVLVQLQLTFGGLAEEAGFPAKSPATKPPFKTKEIFQTQNCPAFSPNRCYLPRLLTCIIAKKNTLQTEDEYAGISGAVAGNGKSIGEVRAKKEL